MKTLSHSCLTIAGLAIFAASSATAQFQIPTGSYANEVSFEGASSTNGVSGYQGPDAATQGHSLISSTAPAGVAYQYVAGRSDGPDPDGATFAASGTTASGFSLFQLNLGSQGYSLSDVKLHFGPASGIFENSWSLGLDRNGLNATTGAAVNPGGVLGVDHEYEAWQGSSVEGRFYSASASDVFYYLSVGGVRIVDIGYADLYMRIDYGATSSGSDDVVQAYHTVSGVSITSGLTGPEHTIANGFVNDVNNAGGGVQVIIDSVQAAVTGAFNYNGQIGSHFAIDGRLVAVNASAVPEPGSFALWGALAAMFWVGARRHRTISPEPVTQP